jgi:hypothetical protein
VKISINYRGEVSANPIAKNIIPSAEIAVRTLLTFGFARTTDDLSTARIIDVYQLVETNAWVQERINIPGPKAKVLGTNCGMKATANRAAFTLVKFVINPNRNAGQNSFLAEDSKSNFPNSFFN